MTRNGARPTKLKHKDYDYLKSRHPEVYAGTTVPTFPDEFYTDKTLDFPDQEAIGLPYGCTDLTQSSLTNDLYGEHIHDPFELDAITHANAKGGYGIRDSLDQARKLGWIGGFFNIRPKNIDWFDSIRLAVMSGVPEERSVSVGTPWYQEWMGQTGVLPMPHVLQVSGPWHNYKIYGWKTASGVPYLIAKTWQGPKIDPLYLPRDVVNAVMSQWGTCAFTATRAKPLDFKTVDLSWIQSLMSYLRSLMGLSY